MKFRKKSAVKTVGIDMTPMIDIVFQLIIFFMLSLKLFSAEGDFNIKMPLSTPREGVPDEAQVLPVKVRLHADRKGNLAGITMGSRKLNNFKELQSQIHEIVSQDRGPAGSAAGSELELDCDYNLKYENVVNVLTASSGYLSEDKKSIIRLMDKIRFTPTRKRIE